MALRVFQWEVSSGASVTNKLKVSKVSFGDYEQIFSIGINNHSRNLSISMTDKLAVIGEAELFLLEHEGITPFTITIDDIAGNYRTVGDIAKTHIGYNVWALSATLEQVFLPQEVI